MARPRNRSKKQQTEQHAIIPPVTNPCEPDPGPRHDMAVYMHGPDPRHDQAHSGRGRDVVGSAHALLYIGVVGARTRYLQPTGWQGARLHVPYVGSGACRAPTSGPDSVWSAF
ncbi:uncharacterized protein UV8b_01009 [Ustilaginoidea virens]|uniref:Uncharacterized protein n=1 Tax=Ustilaginoidea virens TaxID=1159556 RepID=A0A8E5HJY1_USTVR|nr:uncharacterized protein UV8b_01009 [Ustilaginoidea virens]QUC16768.1 hypothetical protein UV8b_01009 [Ustilaginoidea virens]